MAADAVLSARFTQCYRAWVAGWRPGSALAEARAELHRFASAGAAASANFEALVLQIPWLIDAQRGEAAYKRMAVALRELSATNADTQLWEPPASLDCGCDACFHLLNAVALFVRAPP